MISPEQFVKQFSNQQEKTNVQFGTVDSQHITGRPSVIYDIDIVSGTLSKKLPYLEAYTPGNPPQPNDRVMIVNGVILGRIR